MFALPKMFQPIKISKYEGEYVTYKGIYAEGGGDTHMIDSVLIIDKITEPSRASIPLNYYFELCLPLLIINILLNYGLQWPIYPSLTYLILRVCRYR